MNEATFTGASCNLDDTLQSCSVQFSSVQFIVETIRLMRYSPAVSQAASRAAQLVRPNGPICELLTGTGAPPAVLRVGPDLARSEGTARPGGD